MTIIILIGYVFSIFYIKYDHMRRNYDSQKSHRLMKIALKYLTFYLIVVEILVLFYLYALEN